MSYYLAYAFAYIVTWVLIGKVPSLQQWFPLALIIIILDWLYQVYVVNARKEEPFVELKEEKKQAGLKQGNDIRAVWNGCSIVFYENGLVTARLNRDRNGNIGAAAYGKADGFVESILIHGSRHYTAFINYKDSGVADETITWMRNNGSKFACVHIEHGAFLNGPFEIYFPSGQLKKTGWLNHGKPEGKVRIFHADGGLKKLFIYKNGRRHGSYEVRAVNNKIIETGSYEDGKRSGYVLKYYDSGALKEETYYRHGKELTQTSYRRSGGVDKDKICSALALAGAKEEDLKGLRRLARIREKLGKYGLEIYNSQSNMFPRERGIRIAGKDYNLREFSCEEELIKTVLDKEKFEEILERMYSAKNGKKSVWYYNQKGKLVRER